MFGGRHRRRWNWDKPARRRYTVLVWLGLLVIGWFAPEFAVNAQQIDDDAALQFDISAQPLASALKVYSARVQLRLFYDSSLMEGRRSPPLRGTMSARAALRTLLDGTGFSVTTLQSGAATILSSAPPQDSTQAKLAAMKSKAVQFTSYFAALQAGIRSALCRSPAIQVDKTERIIRLWIAPSGAVGRAELISSAGTQAQDEAYAAAIRTLVIDQPPPANLPQPVTMMVLPRDSRVAAECDRFAAVGSGAP
jgi:hypothetical protein